MLRSSKLPKTLLTIALNSLVRAPCFWVYSSGRSRAFADTISNNHEPDSENEWESLLKPFDLQKLRKSLNRISPYQLCKLLQLPLDPSTSMEIFEWAGTQKGFSYSFDVYYALIDKLGPANEFKLIDRLLLQMKSEGLVFRESLFILIMKYYGRADLPGQATRLILDMKGLTGSMKQQNWLIG